MKPKLTVVMLVVVFTVLGAVPSAAAPDASPCIPSAAYDPACDVNHDGAINVLDIQLAAGHWNQTGAFTSDSWLLTGNSGTSPAVNFLGTTDNQALEIKANGQRALRVEPTIGPPNLIGGVSTNNVTVGVYGATISGGGASAYPNRVTDHWGTVGGGEENQAGNGTGSLSDAEWATVAGGYGNAASAWYATVAGGGGNTAEGQYSTVGGGIANLASGTHSVVSGGTNNSAGGTDAVVPGGYLNSAAGSYSFAAGRRAKANNTGAFVLADSNDFDLSPGVNNAFTARFTGGARFILGINGTGTATWLCAVYNGGSWGCSSDRNVKENFQPVDGKAILAKLADLPITTWNAIGTDPQVRRMGPMAQDFYAAFGLGDSDKVITTGDLDGVALAGIQGLYEITQEKDAQLAAQQRQIDAQQAQLDDQQAQIETLIKRLTALEQGSSTAP